MKDQVKIPDWTNQLLARGKYSFTLENLYHDFPEKSAASIKMGLKRLVEKNKIISISKGFYIIVPPSYANLGFLPPSMFMHELMAHLNKPYYISLLSAAAMHGAGHQQPQTHFVCTTLPSIRNTSKKGIQIKYICKRNFPERNLVQKKTDSGYVTVSDPLLTCLDMINFYKTIGGFNRAATVIDELSEEINNDDLTAEILNIAPQSDVQRLGYLWEYVCDRAELANMLYDLVKKNLRTLKSYKLVSSKTMSGNSVKNRWRINVNVEIETDE